MRTTGLAAALVLIVATLTGCAAVRGTDDAPPRIITATGAGRISTRPDTAVVQVGAETRAPSLADATADVSRRISAVLERVKALGVAEREITTVTYAIDPVVAQRRSEEEAARILGYRVANVVQLRIRQLDAVGRIMDAAVAAGANTMRGLTFTVADPQAVEAQARVLAVQNASAKAKQLAEAAGATLGELVLLTEGVPQPSPRQIMGARAADVVGPGPVESGQLEILVTVTAHYLIGKPRN
jgi:uncharacterized protein YggE